MAEVKKVVITPQRKLFDVNLKELYHARDIIRMFVYRDYKVRFKQTMLGPLWFIISPLLTTFIFTFVFSKIAQVPTGDMHPLVFYYGGILGWNYFATSLTSTANVFLGNVHLFSKVYFPRLVSPISALVTNGIQFLIQWATFYLLILVLWCTGQDVSLGWQAVFVPLLILQLAMMAFGFGALISSVTVKYRDLNQLLGFGVQLWMFVTPIVYPSSVLPEKFAFIAVINPVAPIIEGIRACISGVGTPDIGSLLVSLLFSLFIFVLGVGVFNRVEKNFIDVV